MWRVGSPYDGKTPPAEASDFLQAQAEKMRYDLSVAAFPTVGFADRFFQAVDAHREPEILLIDNFFVIDGGTTPLGQLTGIASREDIRRNLLRLTSQTFNYGFPFLVASARNFEAAKKLALTEPDCPTAWVAVNPLPADKSGLAAVTNIAARAYLTGGEMPDDADRIAYSASDTLYTSAVTTSRTGLRVHFVRPCGYWGNQRLAFVPLVTVFESNQPVRSSDRSNVFRNMGRQDLLLILRRDRDDNWKVLGVSSDEGGIINGRDRTVRVAPKLQDLFGRDAAGDAKPVSAAILHPDDGVFPVPAAGQRFGDFVWRPSRSKGVSAEMVEFTSADLGGYSRFILNFRAEEDTNEERVSAGSLVTAGMGWKWDHLARWVCVVFGTPFLSALASTRSRDTSPGRDCLDNPADFSAGIF